MHKEVKEILTEHMKEFGLNMIGRGIVNAITAEILTPYGHAMSVVHVAHGAEIVLKARIAEEHPLLIFTKVPKSDRITSNKVGLLDLLEDGQTIMYNELPERLWACTGYKLKNIDLYNKFGKTRNQIIHLAVPEVELADFTLKFAFKVIEPAINEWWDMTLLDFGTNYDGEFLTYVFEQLIRLKLSVNYKVINDYDLVKKTRKSPK